MNESGRREPSILTHMRVREFLVPPIRDSLVVGTRSPIGNTALSRALALLEDVPFDTLPLEDDVIGHILVRHQILRRIPENRLRDLVLRRIKPLMDATEILRLDLEAELVLEDRI